jgi:replicative DNA helicase
MANENNLRIPPQSIDSEKALLGAIMIKPEALHDIGDIITPSSFYAEKHRIIFNTMLDLHTKSDPIDLLSLSTRLKENKSLDQIGGSSYLAELVNGVPSAANAQHYARIVQKKSTLRNLISVGDAISEMGYEENVDVEQTLDTAEKKIYEVTNSPGVHKFTSIAQSLDEAWDRIDHLHNAEEEIRGIQSGFKALDTILAGFQKSDLIILAARPSMGKTAFALDIARQAATKYDVPQKVESTHGSLEPGN